MGKKFHISAIEYESYGVGASETLAVLCDIADSLNKGLKVLSLIEEHLGKGESNSSAIYCEECGIVIYPNCEHRKTETGFLCHIHMIPRQSIESPAETEGSESSNQKG